MIERVESKRYTCDNPICERQFVVDQTNELAVVPGYEGTVLSPTAKGREPLNLKWFAHSLRCVGPAIKSVLERT